MLLNLDKHVEDGKVEVFAETRCRVCNRCLTTPESVQSGIGPICDGRSTEKAEFAKLEAEQEQKAFESKYKTRESLYAQNRLGSGPAEAYISPVTGNMYTGD